MVGLVGRGAGRRGRARRGHGDGDQRQVDRAAPADAAAFDRDDPSEPDSSPPVSPKIIGYQVTNQVQVAELSSGMLIERDRPVPVMAIVAPSASRVQAMDTA